MEVEKRSFSEADLVQMAEEMSEEFDYGLHSSSFISDFVDKGIIHFESGKAIITLPFIRAYLLAAELSNNEDLAKKYFDFESFDFDLLTFDLYTEIGPSSSIREGLVQNLRTYSELSELANGEHILLNHSLNPKLLNRPASLKNLSSRISKAREAITNDQSDRAEKVRILEVADRVQETIAERRDSTKQKSEASSHEADLDRLISFWLLATVMLGSAAESLKPMSLRFPLMTMRCTQRFAPLSSTLRWRPLPSA